MGKAEATASVATPNVAITDRVAIILDALKGLSHRETQQALNMASVVHNLRVIPIDRPISLPKVVRNPAPTKQQKPAVDSYKKNPKWIELQSKRTAKVNQLKNLEHGSTAHAVAIQDLRSIEQEIRDFKEANAPKAEKSATPPPKSGD